MSFFFLKKPACLDFMIDAKDEKYENPDMLQIRTKNNKSNSKLCKRKDGSWFIKCGSIKMELTNTKIKERAVVEKNETGGDIIGVITKKWFLKANKSNK